MTPDPHPELQLNKQSGDTRKVVTLGPPEGMESTVAPLKILLDEHVQLIPHDERSTLPVADAFFLLDEDEYARIEGRIEHYLNVHKATAPEERMVHGAVAEILANLSIQITALGGFPPVTVRLLLDNPVQLDNTGTTHSGWAPRTSDEPHDDNGRAR